jgi:hypothetical protein
MKDYLRNFKDFSKNSVALSEGRVTKEDWDKMGEDEKVAALLTAYKDPNDAEKYFNYEFDDLPDVATQAMNIKMKDDGFTGDLDQADDGVVTLDSLAMDEFGMTYDQLGPGEREWCQDEYDNLNK